MGWWNAGGNCDVDSVAHCEGGSGEGVGAVQERLSVVHVDGEASELVLSVAESGGGHGIGDEGNAGGGGCKECADDGGVYVVAVGDELEGDVAAVEGCADGSGFPVSESGHGIECVGEQRRSSIERCGGGGVVCAGVSDGDIHSCRGESVDRVQCVRQFRGDCDLSKDPVSCGEERVNRVWGGDG